MRILPGRAVPSLVVVLATSALQAQVPARWSGCGMDSLATWNCARYYSGTASLTSELRGPNLHQTLRIVATVTEGRVRCRITGTEAGDFEGPGMIAVETSGTGEAGAYAFSVWCPDAADRPVRRRDSPVIMVRDQAAADYTRLQGTDAHDHPDADAANGLAGTETIAWELTRR